MFLGGTYTVASKLTFSGSAPSVTQPNQWVGADSSGNILRPKFDETGIRLDLTDYPVFRCTANTPMVDTEENTYYKCLSFENTNTSYSQASVVEITTADNTDTLTLTSTDADANAGPNLRLYRNSGSPADSDLLGQIDFEGRNDNSQDVVFRSLTDLIHLIGKKPNFARGKKIETILSKIKRRKLRKETLGGCVIKMVNHTVILTKEQ